MWLVYCPARGPEWDLSLYLWGPTHKEMDSTHVQIWRVLCRSHCEATYLAEHSHGLSSSDVLLFLQGTLGQPLPLQNRVKSL